MAREEGLGEEGPRGMMMPTSTYRPLRVHVHSHESFVCGGGWYVYTMYNLGVEIVSVHFGRHLPFMPAATSLMRVTCHFKTTEA